jgi:hypothetical protein
VAGCGGGTDGSGAGPQTEAGSGAPGPAQGDASPRAAEPTQDDGFGLGAPRKDLERFYGVYGDPEKPNRSFFVAQAKLPPGSEMALPPGYLMVGAMWGDVAPWYMESVSDTRFEQRRVSSYAQPVNVEFDLGPDGRAAAVTFETVFDDRGRLERLRDLPDGW